MEQLISDSVTIIKEEDNMQVVYGWMDTGDLICEKQRSNSILKEQELYIINKLTAMLKRIKIEEDIVLYRGRRGTKGVTNVVEANQLNALSPNLKTAETYGPFIMKVTVPKGTNAFYISAWELINTEIGEQEEKEVLLLPGKFTLCGKDNNCYNYLYTQL